MSAIPKTFDAAALKREFPGLAAPELHYLDSAATAQMPEVVLDALRRFEVEARANVHEGLHARARAATEAYNQARVRVSWVPVRKTKWSLPMVPRPRSICWPFRSAAS